MKDYAAMEIDIRKIINCRRIYSALNRVDSGEFKNEDILFLTHATSRT